MAAATTPEELLERLEITPAHLADLLDDLTAAMTREVQAVLDARVAGDDVFPIVAMADVLAGTVTPAQVAAIKRSGCAVVRGTFDREEAEDWDRQLGDYITRNCFEREFLDKHPDAAEGSRIWPVYWSRPQVLARQHPRMVAVRSFLNSLWRAESGGVRWLDPTSDIGYPDRIRRREPGASSKGLAAHVDAPSSGGWRIPENQLVFEPLLRHGLSAYDAFDAAHRTGVDVESPVGCTSFRTFQGWTALSEMHPVDGVLHVVPIPAAVGYRLVHGLAGELAIGTDAPVPAPRRDFGDALLHRALVPIPAVEPGDTVWWHGDLYHAVGDATNDSRWGNVMYIGSSPRCPRNDRYVASMFERFASGRSPVDFPEDDFEVGFQGRATPADLNATGRAQFGLA